MESSLHRLVEGFPANPLSSGKLMQRLLLDNPQQFFHDSLPLLRAAPDSQGFYYVLALLHSQNLVLKNLCDPALFSKPESVALAKRMSRVEPLFDMKLAKMLLANDAGPGPPAEEPQQNPAGMRLLEIMAATSDRGRSLLLAQLLHHASPQVRSKAALLVGKSNKDAKWVSQRMREPDSRVRANAVEALWRVESEDCRQIFETALDDPANRVVGNALLGLYLLGAPSAVGLILKMIAHQEDGFRKTAVWVMGETGDLRFLDALSRLMKDSGPELRTYVFRSFAKLKQKRSRLAALPALRLYASRAKSLPEGSGEIRVSVVSAAGPVLGLKATQFALWENSDLVLDYSVRQVIEKEPLSIAFAIARDAGPHQQALKNCLAFKRKADRWMILQYRAEPGSGTALDPRFMTTAEQIETAINTRAPRQESASNLWDAAGPLLSAVAKVNGSRHLVLLDDGSVEAPVAQLQAITDAAKLADITLHVVGTRAVAEDSVPGLLAGLYANLTARYQVKYRCEDDAKDLGIEVCTEQGLGEVTLSS